MADNYILSDFLITFLNDYWQSISQLFSNSQQRLFWGYWCAAIFIAVCWAFNEARQYKKNIQKMENDTDKDVSFISRLHLKHFITRSAFADYQLIIINKAIFLFVSPYLLTKLVIATSLYESLHYVSSPLMEYTNEIPTWLIVGGFTLWIFLIDDFARFYFHKLMHDIPFLWQFHKVHHSATSLTPLTVLRTHPIEGIIFTFRSALVQGVSIGAFYFCFGNRVDLYTILNLNILVFVFNVLGANLRHSHISISYWRWLESIIISPAQHQIHHSVQTKHFNKNYGAILAIWDRLAGSLFYSEKHQALTFGLNATQSANEQKLTTLYFSSFYHFYKVLKQKMR